MSSIAKITIAEQKMKHLLQHTIMTNTSIGQGLLILMRNVAGIDTVLGTLQMKCTGI